MPLHLAHDAPNPDELDELAALLRPDWQKIADGLRAAGVPLLMADDDDTDTGKDDDRDDDKGKRGRKADTDDDEGTKDRKDRKADDDDDEGDSELDRARKRIAAERKRADEAERELRKRQNEDDEKAGKWKDRAERAEKRLEELEAKIATDAKSGMIEAAAKAAGFRNPSIAFRLLKADGLIDDIEDDVDAKRAVRALAKEDDSLVEKGTRQRRTRDEDDDRDDDRDDDKDNSRSNGKRPVSRLRKGLEATTPAGRRR